MTITVLHPAPDPHHPDCSTGCTGSLVWMAGPCQNECAKTPEFQERCERDAEASRLRFRTQVGSNVLRAVDGVPGAQKGLTE